MNMESLRKALTGKTKPHYIRGLFPSGRIPLHAYKSGLSVGGSEMYYKAAA